MRCLLIGLFIFSAVVAQAQLQVAPLAPATVPPARKPAGRVVQALRYTDRTGTYTVVATETGPVAGKTTDNGRSADLYAAQYSASGAASWQVHDFVADCPLDLQVRFVPGGLSVTDLDGNGTAEVWLVYRTVCRGDVSPSTQKIIFYEGARKYALRGTARLTVGGGQYEGGTYTPDAALQAAPAAFRQHAAALWKRYLTEKPGD